MLIWIKSPRSLCSLHKPIPTSPQLLWTTNCAIVVQNHQYQQQPQQRNAHHDKGGEKKNWPNWSTSPPQTISTPPSHFPLWDHLPTSSPRSHYSFSFNNSMLLHYTNPHNNLNQIGPFVLGLLAIKLSQFLYKSSSLSLFLFCLYDTGS